MYKKNKKTNQKLKINACSSFYLQKGRQKYVILYILSESNGFNCLFPNAVSSILGYKIIENVQLKNAKMCCVKTLTGIKIC